MEIQIAEEARMVLKILQKNDFAAYVVGGCVRDSVLGNAPVDWDVTTNARPQELLRCFAGLRVAETGLRHGTVTVFVDHKPVEVTTYRIDGAYSDNRHPDSVEFTDDLRMDLSRRDFTINAMAYSPEAGLVDYFGGIGDLHAKRIACVGDPGARFMEDGLRMLRAVRFASVLGFTIDTDTQDALAHHCGLLDNIASERIAAEMNKTLTGPYVGRILLENHALFVQILPELAPAIGFSQYNPHHHLDVWQHTVQAVQEVLPDLILRLTMLLHDIGKPYCFTQDTQGIGHFYGHQKRGVQLARDILTRLRYDNATAARVLELILHHDDPVQPERKLLLRWLNRLGEQQLRRLLEVKKADRKSQAPQFLPEQLALLSQVESLLDSILAEKACFTLKDLAVNGQDLLSAGIPEGKQLGVVLHGLLELVLDELVENRRESLMQAVREQLRG